MSAFMRTPLLSNQIGGEPGFWKALPQVFPSTREQRCWVHKVANVLDKMPKCVQPKAKSMLHAIWMAPTQQSRDRKGAVSCALAGPLLHGRGSERDFLNTL